MEGDLSLSQSLGGLRIANPDDALSREPSSSNSESSKRKDLKATTIIPSADPSTDSRQHHGSEIIGGQAGRPLSQLHFDPSTYNSEDGGLSTSPSTIEPTHLRRGSSTRRKPVSSGLPESSHQQSYSQQYSQGYPQTQRQHHGAMRQTQPVYGQVGSPIPLADTTYRIHRETSQSSMNDGSRRNGLRASHADVQAGVPVSEGIYSERSYRNVQHTSGNAPYPPRRSSKNMPAGYLHGQAMPVQSQSMPATRQNSEDHKAIGPRTVLDVNGRPVLDANGQPVKRTIKRGVEDFQFGITLGEGSYSTVLRATDRETGNAYAIKVLDKKHIIKEKKVKYVNIEKDTLNRLNEFPGVVRLYYTFQDNASLYFVLDLASGGELLGVLKKYGTFDEECTRFYGAQILSSIEYMHSKGVIHRDLKPENILLNDHMHTKITDFGTAKILEPRSRASSNVVPLPGAPELDANERAASFVGTAEYVSPELLTDKHAGKPSDLWAFGCIIYQLLAGRPPFKAANEYLTFQKIVALEYTFPRGFPPVAMDLVERLLVLDPERRLTIDHIMNHEFFIGTTFGRGLWQQKAPKLKSYSPPTVIHNLNAPSSSHIRDPSSSSPPDVQPAHSTRPVHISSHGPHIVTPKRPQPRLVTEVPPPSQLDVEWSPILTRGNERIIKVGQQVVLSNSIANSPGVKGEKPNGNTFARLFGGGGNGRKKQRLVMVTSSGRVLVAASDGNEKKTKCEISLMQEGCIWKKAQDPKGLSYWVIDTKDKHFAFEDPKFASPDVISTATASDEWLESLEKARDMAQSQSLANSFSDESRGFASVMSSSANTLELNAQKQTDATASRHILHKNPSTNSAEELKGFKRFSKRQSKSGLAAVF